MSTVSTDRRQGVNAGNALKTPCRVATTASITLAGLQTIDGIALAQDDRVMVKDQATASENGIYTADTGAWARALDFDGPFDVVKGTLIHVTDGTLYARTWWEVTTSNPITPETTSIALLQGITDAGIITFVQSGSGAITGTVAGQLRKFTFLSDWTTAGQFNTARDLLSGTVGLPPAIEQTHSLDSTTTYPWTVRTANTAAADFAIGLGDFTFNGTRDTVLNFGYNCAPGVSRRDAAEPAWVLTFESNYNTGTANLMECHFEGVHTDGTTFRNWSWFVNRSTKDIQHSASASKYSWFDATNVNQAMILNAVTTTTAQLLLSTGTDLVHTVNNESWLYQVNTVGAQLEIAKVNASDQIVLAPAGGTTLTAGKLAVTNSGLGSNSLDVFSSSAGDLAVFQKNNTTSGENIVRIALGSAVTGTSTPLFVRGTTSAALYISIQQDGAGAAVFNALAVSTGDAQSTYNVNGAGIWSVGIDNSDSDNFKISGNAALGTSDALVITGTGLNVGIGTGTFGTNAAGVFAVKNGTAPTTGPADTVQFYSSDIAAGHTEPSFFCEGTQVLATGQADSASSVRVKMRINGTEVTLLAI